MPISNGIPALIEYALGTSDVDPAAGADAVRVGISQDGWLTMVVSRRLGADDAVETMEVSEDLLHWIATSRRSLAPVPGVGGKGAEEWAVAVAGKQAVFLRLTGGLRVRSAVRLAGRRPVPFPACRRS